LPKSSEDVSTDEGVNLKVDLTIYDERKSIFVVSLVYMYKVPVGKL